MSQELDSGLYLGDERATVHCRQRRYWTTKVDDNRKASPAPGRAIPTAPLIRQTPTGAYITSARCCEPVSGSPNETVAV